MLTAMIFASKSPSTKVDVRACRSRLCLRILALALVCGSSALAQTRIAPPAQPGDGKPQAGASQPRTILRRVDPATVIDRRGMGGSVFATGLEPVTMRIFPKRPAPEDLTYYTRIYIVVDGKRRYIGHNRENKVVPLGKLPAGELSIVIDTEGEGISQTGPGSRNSDQLPHAVARDLNEGVVEVRFEGSMGLPEERLVYGNASEQDHARKNHFGDVLLQLTGGVTADATVPLLLESLRSDNPDLRKTAVEALRQAHRRIARSAGLFGSSGR